MKGWVDRSVGYILKWFACPQTVTHPSRKHVNKSVVKDLKDCPRSQALPLQSVQERGRVNLLHSNDWYSLSFKRHHIHNLLFLIKLLTMDTTILQLIRKNAWPEILQHAVDSSGWVEKVNGPTRWLEPRHRKRVRKRTNKQRPDCTDRRHFVRQQSGSCLVAKYQKHDPYTTTTTKLLDLRQDAWKVWCTWLHKWDETHA